MLETVLLQKIYGEVSLSQFEEFLKQLCGGLRVELSGFSLLKNRWVKTIISGEDEEVASLFLEREVGLAPINKEHIRQFSVLQGRVVFSKSNNLEILVDVGVISPKPIYASLPLQQLQGQLTDNRKFSLERIVKLFGLADELPLEVRVIRIKSTKFEAELTENQLRLYSRWIDSRVDRLVVLGALGSTVREAVKKARLQRDVLSVESLGIVEHVVVPKLGTDAAGLVPKLGRQLPKTSFVHFSPRKILMLIPDRW
ncbi:MAG: DUF2110 family protein [Candidatus Bathyarchaeota archaeon]|nr:MAG: DUF2110 family protein [Candidatus Bathyarchaeota archaeon]